MCGRFVQQPEKQRWEARFGVAWPAEAALRPRYNLAPTQPAAVITADGSGARRWDACAWGLVPGWARDVSMGARLINARAETVWEKPSFRDAIRYRRCLVPANGFYEWTVAPRGGGKVPLLMRLEGVEVFAFAGLWEVWHDRDGGRLHTFTIVTTTARAPLDRWHGRMPVVLAPEQEAAWLDPGRLKPEAVNSLLRGVDAAWRVHPVSTRVNRATYDAADCMEEVPWPGSASSGGAAESGLLPGF
jgi:putative SOS response-associated peptidase YedK